MWILLGFPDIWLPAIVGSFLSDNIVLMILLIIKKKDSKFKLWKSCILKLWGFSILTVFSWLSALLWLGMVIFWMGYIHLSGVIVHKPWTNPAAAACVILCMALSSVFVYILYSGLNHFLKVIKFTF